MGKPKTINDLIILCKDPKKDRLQSVNKDVIADILANCDAAQIATKTDGASCDIQATVANMALEITEIRKSNDKIVAILNRMEKMEIDMENMKTENDRLKNALGRQGQLLKQHQMYFEKVDAKEREKNLILIGVPEGSFLGTEADGEKVDKILETLGDGAAATRGSVVSLKRLGTQQADRDRPILAVVPNVEQRNNVVAARRACTHNDLRGIRVKKDTHPAVRAEWTRLFDAKRDEEQKPENVGRRIEIDMKKRQLTCDGQVIDSWQNQLF
jgi:hypothetical protein